MKPSAAKTPSKATHGDLPPAAADVLAEYEFNLSLVRGVSPRTVAAYVGDLKALFRHLARHGIAGPSGVEARHLRTYLIDLHEMGRKAATVARARAAVRSLFAFLVDEGIVASDPTVDLAAPGGWKKIPRALTVDQARALLEGVSGEGPLDLRDRALLETAYGTGARSAELLGLTLDDCRWGQKLLKLTGKGERVRLVPIGRAAAKSLRAYTIHGRPVLRARRRDPAEPRELFLNARGGRLSRMGFWKILQKRAREAALDVHVHPHLLRHSYATHLLRGGASLRVVQELLGHARLATTQIYTSVDEPYLQQAHRRCHPRG
jgi:site-specific recombinase XerD